MGGSRVAGRCSSAGIFTTVGNSCDPVSVSFMSAIMGLPLRGRNARNFAHSGIMSAPWQRAEQLLLFACLYARFLPRCEDARAQALVDAQPRAEYIRWHALLIENLLEQSVTAIEVSVEKR